MTEESIGGSKELAVCKNQLAHFRAAAKRLREQRDQLRSKFAYAESEVLVLTDELEHLKAENEKLRTALSAVLQCSGITKRDKGCDACPMYDKEKEYVWAGDWCGIRQFIRELGVDE